MFSPVATARRAAIVGAVVVLVAGCGSSAKSASSPSSPTPTTVSANDASAPDGSTGAIPAGSVLNVGDQEQLIETLFKVSGENSNVPYKLNFVEFGSGPLVDSGFAAGRIDAGFMGDLPAALAVQSGVPVAAVATAVGIGANEYLVAKPGITSIAQLKGKKVAYTTGTAEQAFALRALATAGLKQPDVDQVNVTLQQLYTVLETGQVDASVIGGGQQEEQYLQQHHGAKVLATNATVSPASYEYVLATNSGLSNPAKSAEIQDFTKRLIAKSNWAYNHQSQFAKAFLVDQLHETPSQAQDSVGAGLIFRWVPISSAVQAALQNVVSLEAGTGAIKSQFDVSSLFNAAATTAYNRIVQEVPQSAPANG